MTAGSHPRDFIMIDHQAALIYTMVLVSAADRNMSHAELRVIGAAVTTQAFAVGARCPHAMSGVGAIATQSFTNPMFGTRGLRLLQEGVAARDVVDILVAGDEGRAIRQLHLIDAKGRNAAYTG